MCLLRSWQCCAVTCAWPCMCASVKEVLLYDLQTLNWFPAGFKLANAVWAPGVPSVTGNKPQQCFFFTAHFSLTYNVTSSGGGDVWSALINISSACAVLCSETGHISEERVWWSNTVFQRVVLWILMGQKKHRNIFPLNLHSVGRLANLFQLWKQQSAHWDFNTWNVVELFLEHDYFTTIHEPD